MQRNPAVEQTVLSMWFWQMLYAGPSLEHSR